MTVRHAQRGTGVHTLEAPDAAAGNQSGRLAQGRVIAATGPARLVGMHPAVAPAPERGSCIGPCSSRPTSYPATRVEAYGQSRLLRCLG